VDSLSKARSAGYRLERVYVAEQAYRLVDPEPLRESKSPADRKITFLWDWRPLAPRRFEVILEMQTEPIKQAPEVAQVRFLGVFEADEGELSVPFHQFIRVHAPAILFPFAREVISTMTGRGPHGAFHLNPLNIAALISHDDLVRTTGYQYLQADPKTASDFGLDVHPPAVPTAQEA
jgi:preprotein translocase subunit SecB